MDKIRKIARNLLLESMTFIYLTAILMIMKKALVTRYYNGKVLRNHRLIEEDFWIHGEKIVAPASAADREIDLMGKIIAPGYIDLQINGSFGVDFASAPEKWADVARELPKYGVTAFLATVVSQPLRNYKHILAALQPKKGLGAHLLGIHLEGPFLNPDFAGAHDPAALYPSIENIQSQLGSLTGVKMVTLAPELPGALQAIHNLRESGIVVSAGHSNARFAETLEAEKAGLTNITHLFNAMRPFHHREPGLIGAALTRAPFAYSLIVDGIHLHKEVVRLAWQTHPEGLFLISDANAATGLHDGEYQLGKQKIQVQNGKTVLQGSEILAGSVLTLDKAVRNLLSCTGCSPIEALESASLKPARVLGIDKYKGQLNIGADADFNILDEKLTVNSCYVAGQRLYYSP
jgi:N-acetylglucosamine-6-phosphate deacetylase